MAEELVDFGRACWAMKNWRAGIILKRIRADGGSAGQLVERERCQCPRRRIVLDLVKRPDGAAMS